MKRIDIGQTLGILANVAVLAGIIFLALELQQNNELLEAEIRSIRHNIRGADFLLPLQNQDFANALIKRQRGEELTEYEVLIVERSMAATLFNYQYVFTEYYLGKIESLPLENWRIDFDGEIDAQRSYFPDLLEYWESRKDFDYDPIFVAWISDNIIDQ